jgi:hypothetical protein
MIIIKTSKGEEIFVDDCDGDLAKYMWYVGNRGYAQRQTKRIHGKQDTLLMHRVILERKLGRNLLPEHREEVDHCDLQKLNNCRYNLRIASGSQNKYNIKKYGVRSSTYKGVCWREQNQKWQSQIAANGKLIYLGCFKDEVEAAKAYNVAALKYHGEYARLNDV